MAAFSAITLIVCLIGEIYPASKFSSNPAFPSIIILQLFSMLVALLLRRRLLRRREDAQTSLQSQQSPPEKVDRLLPLSVPVATERTTELMEPVPTEIERK
jgi:ABC-type Fe3+ transport system permease subunit